MKKRMLCLLMAMVVLLLPLLLAACNDPNYMGTLPPAASGGQEGGEKLSEEDLQIPDLTPPQPELTPSPSEPMPEPTDPIEPTPEPTPAPPVDIPEPEKYTTEWLEWLVDDYGEVYSMCWSGGLYNAIRYKDNMEPSSFELWPCDNGEVNENSRFFFCPFMNAAEFDGYTNLGTEEYEYTWKVFYREEGGEGEYGMVEMTPWSAILFGDNYLYRLNIHDYGEVDMHLKEDGSTNTYHVIMVIEDQEGEIVIWRDEFVDWTDSSEAFYQDALELGVIGKK